MIEFDFEKTYRVTGSPIRRGPLGIDGDIDTGGPPGHVVIY